MRTSEGTTPLILLVCRSALFLALTIILPCGCGSDRGGESDLALTSTDLSSRILLSEGWFIQSSQIESSGGEIVSLPGWSTDKWYPATVPSTVLSALVDAGVYPDPYVGMNLRSIPGTQYPIGSNFSNLPMPLDSPFRWPWWYRTEFFVPETWKARRVFLAFNGINFRADVWLNGELVADARTLAGTYRTHSMDVTPAILFGEINCVAVKVYAPKMFDLAHTWVDWNPMPPDKNMGLWREVILSTCGDLKLRNPHVITHLPDPRSGSAELTVTAEIVNTTDDPVQGMVTVRIEAAEVTQEVALEAREVREVVVCSDQFPDLRIDRPRLWWPLHMGEQQLYDLEIVAHSRGLVSDRTTVRFGIREVATEIDERGNRVFLVNGERVLIRGAGWAPDMLFRYAAQREEAEIAYVRDLNLNAIRLEGKLGSDHLLDLCDQNGILVLAGWCCCDHWEHWPLWDKEDYRIAAESLKSQICRLRNHPSVIAWFNGSDFHPPADVEQMYLDILAAYRWPNAIVSSATEVASPVSGPTGMKMTGPYDYVPPIYWYADTRFGGAFGFNTETSPGPSIPPVESLRAMLLNDTLWPIDDVWNYHAGGGQFKNIEIFTKALEKRYGPARDLEDFLRKAQAMNYEAHRAMLEAYGRNKYNATGIIQWMLNDAWPSLIWHLYDYYLRPAGSYFGAKKACEPLHVQYSYDDRSVVVVNSYRRDMGSMKVDVAVLDFDMKVRYHAQETVYVVQDSVLTVLQIPEIPDLTKTYFVDLVLSDASGSPVSSNFYWLSTRPDVMAWGLSDWYYTPTLVYGDLSMLESLPLVELDVASKLEQRAKMQRVSITVANHSSSLAFMVRLQITKGRGGEEVLPVMWEDNYVSILPGRVKEIVASYESALIQGCEPAIVVSGWNVAAVTRTVGQ